MASGQQKAAQNLKAFKAWQAISKNSGKKSDRRWTRRFSYYSPNNLSNAYSRLAFEYSSNTIFCSASICPI